MKKSTAKEPSGYARFMALTPAQREAEVAEFDQEFVAQTARIPKPVTRRKLAAILRNNRQSKSTQNGFNRPATRHQNGSASNVKERHAPQNRLFVEQRPQGDFAVRKPNSDRATAIAPTQAEAIEIAKRLNPGIAPLVERIRHTDTGKPDKWRTP